MCCFPTLSWPWYMREALYPAATRWKFWSRAAFSLTTTKWFNDSTPYRARKADNMEQGGLAMIRAALGLLIATAFLTLGGMTPADASIFSRDYASKGAKLDQGMTEDQIIAILG